MQKNVSPQKIVYVSYGSNLASRRFNAYIAGGTVEGNTRVYKGCRDKTLPEFKKPYILQGNVIMGWESKNWGGGIAFYNPSGEGHTLASGYLITVEQFNDVVSQENEKEAGDITIDFETLLKTGELTLPGLYGKVLYIGYDNGVPMVTFTYSGKIKELEFNAAGTAYLNIIREGVKETFDLDDKQVENYLQYINTDPNNPRYFALA
jgi:hypothetical protein